MQKGMGAKEERVSWITSRSLAEMGKTRGEEHWRVGYQVHGEWPVDKFLQGRCSLGRHMWCQACVWTVLGDSI